MKIEPKSKTSRQRLKLALRAHFFRIWKYVFFFWVVLCNIFKAEIPMSDMLFLNQTFIDLSTINVAAPLVFHEMLLMLSSQKTSVSKSDI